MTKTIGRFELRGELGRGSQSTVYLAFDPQLQRETAIKTLHFGAAKAAQNQALLDEARMVSQLRHPNIVPIFEAGEEGGDIYLVFEYVPGRNLAELLRAEGALPPVRAVGILRPILDAIAHAHGQGLIHRDLKPSNILIDADGTPRVMDFGIAARIDSEESEAGGYVGTPAYLAPEYVREREISERTDIFAAGLVFFEMLTGQRAIQGASLREMLSRIAGDDVRLPESAAVDDRLAAILYKSLARDPALRFQTAVQFAEALDQYLEPADSLKAGEGKQATLDFLLRRMRHKSDFPALSESVSTINKIANSETESISKLSNVILKDFSLTNKLLRLVNSAYFRPAGGGNISTVSRAVVVLGFESVRNIAITVLLFEHLQNKGNVQQLKEEFLKANLAGLLGRELSQAAKMGDLEQSFICALFHNLGRLLAQYYFPEECDEIRRVQGQRNCSEDQAALQVLGISYEDLGLAIARQWGFPPLIVGSLRRLDAGPVRKATTQEERLRVLASFSNALCEVVTQSPELREQAMDKAIQRYAEAVAISERGAFGAIERSAGEVAEFAQVIRLNMQQTAFGRQIQQYVKAQGRNESGETASLASATANAEVIAAAQGELSAADSLPTAQDAASILTAGIQDISNTLVEGFKLNDILRIILETMYRAMGFKRVLLCIRDAKNGCMQGRFGFGPDVNELAKAFRFPLGFAPDVFHAATAKCVDIQISDIDEPNIATRIPAWYRKAVPAKSFVLFPLSLKGSTVALIYADADERSGVRIAEKELTLLRTLRNQAILAIKQGG